APQNQVQFRPRLLEREARLEPPHKSDVALVVRQLPLRIERKRQPDVNSAGRPAFSYAYFPEFGRHNPDDRPALASQRQRLADDGRIAAAAALPELVTSKR